MQNKWLSVLLGALLMGCLLSPNSAQAQSWSEANTQGFFGGYGHFGGYYDTFGDYGGHTNYRGYVRTEGYRSQAVTLVTIPLSKHVRTKHAHSKLAHNVKRSRVKVVTVASDCGWLKQRAHDTGKQKWKVRYDTCRHRA